jgi:hypothetical protein
LRAGDAGNDHDAPADGSGDAAARRDAGSGETQTDGGASPDGPVGSGGVAGMGGAGGAAADAPSDAPPNDGAVDAAADVTTDAGPDGGADVGVDAAADLAADGGAAADAGGGVDATPPACPACSTYGSPRAIGPSPSVLPELSGLAASRVHPGFLYTHNDSGDSARFFALDQTAKVNAEIHLSGATATDWEAISVGDCPNGSCVYVGDIGDNKLQRDEYVIYRVAEPSVLPGGGAIISVAYERFPFVYPDGRHNAETLLVHPLTGQIFVIIKETGIPATVYEVPMPLDATKTVTVKAVASLAILPSSGIVTDGAFHPCGDRLLIRTTLSLFEIRGASASLPALFSAPPVTVPVPDEPQGEGVTYALDGLSYFTSSETVSGKPVPNVSVVGCGP